MKTVVSLIWAAAVGFGAACPASADVLTIPLAEKPVFVADGVFSDAEYAASSMFGGLIHKEKKRMVARDGDYDAAHMIVVTSASGFGGVKVKGFDTSLIAGRFKATCECAGGHRRIRGRKSPGAHG